MSNESSETPWPFIKLPHFRQETDYTCLPACVRMVLAYYRDERTESELSRLLDARPMGTRTERLYRLSRLGYEVIVDSASFSEVEIWLAEQTPVIATVDSTYLPYGSVSGFWHAVVVVGMTTEEILLHDPMQDQAPLTVTRREFRDAWLDTDFEAAVITPPIAAAL